MRTAVAFAFAFCLLPAAASAQQSNLVSAQIWSWKPLDRKTLIVEDTIHRKFKVSLYAPCPGIDFNIGAAIQTRGNTALDCVGRGDVVIHRGYGMGNRCPIKSVELDTPAMEKADAAARSAKVQPKG